MLLVCLCFLLSHLLSQVHRRQKQLSDFVETKKYWALPKSCGSQSSEWEERKKSRGKSGSLCARRRSRKTVTCHGRRVVEPVYIRPYCAADGGAGGELRGRASLAAVTVSRHIRLASFCALVQSRRRPEKWTRTGKWDSRRSVTVDFVCVCTLFGLHFFRKTTVAGDAAVAGGAGGALGAGASLVTVDVLTGHICSVSSCLYVPTERDKYVWLVQSRRRPVDQDLEGGLTRQCNTRLSFLIMCCVWESLSQDDDGGLLRSRWTCSRSGRSARRAGPNAAGVLVILSKHTFKRVHSSLCQRNYEQVRLVHLLSMFRYRRSRSRSLT